MEKINQEVTWFIIMQQKKWLVSSERNDLVKKTFFPSKRIKGRIAGDNLNATQEVKIQGLIIPTDL